MTMAQDPAFRVYQQRMARLGFYDAAKLGTDEYFGPGMHRGMDALLHYAEKGKGVGPMPAPLFPNLPEKYAWLKEIGQLPRILSVALSTYGTLEVPGSSHSPVIMAWAEELKAANVAGVAYYNADEIPWCGLAVAFWAHKAGYTPVDNPLWALNWAKFGNAPDYPGLGDVLSFVRNGGGHVGLYIGEDATTYFVLGGNQSNRVNIMRIEKKRLRAARRCPFAIGAPATVRPYRLATTGAISRNEA